MGDELKGVFIPHLVCANRCGPQLQPRQVGQTHMSPRHADTHIPLCVASQEDKFGQQKSFSVRSFRMEVTFFY